MRFRRPLFFATLLCLLAHAAYAQLSLSCTSNSGPTTAGVTYSDTCTASGGVPPYTWTQPTLPAGLSTSTSIDTTQFTISGTPTTAGSYSYTVQVTDTLSATQTQSFSGTIAPNITSLSPTSTAAGQSSNVTLTVNGAGFGLDSVVSFNTTALATTVVNSNQVTAAITPDLIALATTASITLASAGATSNAASFPVTPTVTSLSPSFVAAGNPGFTLTVNGTGFNPDVAIQWEKTAIPTTYVSATQATAAIPASLVATAGTVPVMVVTASLVSNGLPFTIAAAPTLSSISPTTITAGSASFTLTANGANFASNAVVQWNGTALTTSFVNSTQLTASVPANLVSSPGTVPITVSSGGVTSNAVTLTITPGPAITSLSPSSVAAGHSAFPLRVNGSNFGSDAVVNFNGTALATIVVNSGQLAASVHANLVASPGTVPVTVTSGGVTSAPANFAIAGAPVITSLSPSSASVGGPAFTLTVNGSNFGSDTTVNFNGTSLTPSAVSSGQATVTVPANLITTAGTVPVSVTSGGVTSAAVTFTVLPPSITSTTPSSITAGSSSFTLTVNGSGFAPGATVEWNGSASGLTTGFVNSTQLTVPNVPANLVANPGTAQITVVSGGVTSNAFTFTIVAGPAISSITPATITAGGPAFTLTVNGSGFASGATVQWNSSVLTTTVVSASQLTASVPANLITNPGSAQITVVSGGVTSNGTTLTIVAGPALSAISPNSITAGSGTFALTATGTGFDTDAVVLWNGSALRTTYQNSNQVTASVPADLVASAGSAQIRVSDVSERVTSNALTFTISAAPTISSISPATITAGSPAFPLTVNGSGFAPGAVVQWNGNPLTTGFVNSTQLTVSNVPANLVASPGTAQINVVSGGVPSNSVTLTIVTGPALASLSPDTITAGSAGFTLRVSGTGFGPDTKVFWSGTELTMTSVNSTQVTASVPASLVANPGAFAITVTSGGVPSNALEFDVVLGPVILGVSPDSVTIAASATLTVTGTGFASGSVVQWNGAALATTFVNTNQLTATLPASDVTQYGTAQVTVVSSGATSNSATVSVGVPAITLTGLQATSTPTQQLKVEVQLASASPTELQGTFQLSFTKSAPGGRSGYTDSALQLACPPSTPSCSTASGGRILNFTVPAGQTSVTVGTLAQGTVEGNITLTLTSLTAAGIDVMPQSAIAATVAVPALPPVITAASITNFTSTGFDVVVTGYSTTLDMNTANFSFAAASGTAFSGGSTFAVDVGSEFKSWYDSETGSSNFGSQFQLTVPFTISGDAGVLSSVTVTLTNSIGTSVAATASP